MTEKKAFLDRISESDSALNSQRDKLRLARTMASEALRMPRQAMWLLWHSMKLLGNVLVFLSKQIGCDAQHLLLLKPNETSTSNLRLRPTLKFA